MPRLYLLPDTQRALRAAWIAAAGAVSGDQGSRIAQAAFAHLDALASTVAASSTAHAGGGGGSGVIVDGSDASRAADKAAEAVVSITAAVGFGVAASSASRHALAGLIAQ